MCRLLCAALLLSTSVDAELRFVSVSPENTSLLDGSPLPLKAKDRAWEWLARQGNGGVLATKPGSEARAPQLVMKVEGLEPGTLYEVHGLFWAHGDAAATADGAKHHAVQLGLSLASMHPFDGMRSDALVKKEPWVVTPNYQTGSVYGLRSAIEKDKALAGMPKLILEDKGLHLIRARLDCIQADAEGRLPVFIGAAGFRSFGQAIFDGVTVSPAADKASANPYLKSKSRLHLAIRAGDPVSLEREIASGADINSLDEEGLTPLFMATASADHALVERLLSKGALPDQDGQSASPLMAAATLADTKLINMLLKAGAKLPMNIPKSHGRLANKVDPSCLHPVVAAISTGSVPALKALTDSSEEFNLNQFTGSQQDNPQHKKQGVNGSQLIAESMERGHWEMVAHLVDLGLSLELKNYRGDGHVLAAVVSAGPDADPALEALLRRGEKMVANKQSRSHDGLNVAVWMGRTNLVRRFLPQATDVGPYYKNGLLDRAIASGKPEIIELVREQLPDAEVARWKADNAEQPASQLNTSSRLFLPRTQPPADSKKADPAGKRTLAVLAAPDAAPIGDMLTLRASQGDLWQVVDRDLVEAALLEGRFSKPWLKGEHQLAKIGDLLKADCLVVVSSIRINGNSIHCFELVEVATGLEIHREHIRGDAFVDKTEMAGLLERMGRAFNIANSGDRHQAVTLLNFTTETHSGKTVGNPALLRAAIRHAVDSTPGIISISRAQSAKLMEEQALAGKNSVWGAAHTIEGAISSSGEDSIKVTLRLETFRNGTTVKTDVEASGMASKLPEIAAVAWEKLLAKSGVADDNNKTPSADPARSLQEGRRLMREADWLHAMKADPATYLPLIESAVALGIPSKESIKIHLDGCFRHLLSRRSRDERKWDNDKIHLLAAYDQVTPGRWSHLDASQQLAHQLPAARNMLNQASWYLERGGTDALSGGTNIMHDHGIYMHNEIWHAIQALTLIQSRIFPEQIPQSLRSEYANFTIELQALTSRYFELLKDVEKPDPYRYHPKVLDTRMTQTNPALVSGFVTMSKRGAPLVAMLPDRASTGLNYYKRLEWQWLRKELARKILAEIDADPPAPQRVTKADLECFIAESTSRPAAVRNLIETCANSRWWIEPTRQMSDSYLVSQGILDVSTTSHLYALPTSYGSLSSNESLIPSVLFLPTPHPDYFNRFNTYHQIFHIINQRTGWAEAKQPSNIDPFRERIQGYYIKELFRLKSLSTKLRPVNAPPGQTISRHGPPGISYRPNSQKLLSVLYGSKKIASKQSTGKRSGAPSGRISIKATLLSDLRTTNMPGTLIWPMVDSTDPGLLWVFHFPSTDNSIRVNLGGGASPQDPRHTYSSPWLLGVNCRDGSIVHKIDLHGETGKAYAIDLSHRQCNVWYMGLAQTKKHILTSVGWHDPKYSGNKMGSVIIDKATGSALPIEGNPVISTGMAVTTLDIWDRYNGAASAGEHLFFLSRARSSNGGAVKGMRSSTHAVFQITPELEKTPLTVTGRKPEISPFDAINRTPLSITSNQDRLVIVNPAVIAEYEPVTKEWSITASSPQNTPTKAHTLPKEDANYWAHLRSLNELTVDGEPTGWIVRSWFQPSGFMPVYSRTKGVKILNIEGELPEAFRNEVMAYEDPSMIPGKKTKEKRTLFKDYPWFKKLQFVVLAQTEKDLILGVQTSHSQYYEWNHPSRNSHHLPFLWKASKREILERLEPGGDP